MQHVLVHIDTDLGPIGAWGFLDGGLTQFYPESLDLSISSRARQYMAGREPDCTVPEWFGYLTDHARTALDQFEAIEVNDGVSLPAVVAEFRKHWNADRTR